MEFSIESLISAVERRPELWDTNSDQYKFKSNKKEAWLHVCHEIFDDFDQRARDERLMIEKAVVSKWRTVRDGYVRTLRKQQISGRTGGRAGKRAHDYIYAERLHFLERIVQAKLAEEYPEITLWDSLEVGESSSDEIGRLSADYQTVGRLSTEHQQTVGGQSTEWQQTVGRLQATDQHSSREAEQQHVSMDTMLLQQHLVSLSAHMRQHDAADTDDNMLFLRSLLPSMRKLSSSQQLAFRVQTMQNLQQLLRLESDQSPHSSN